MTFAEDLARAEAERAAAYSASLVPLREEDRRRALVASWSERARAGDVKAQRKDAEMFRAIDDAARDREDAASDRETKERDRPKPFRKRPE